MTDIVMPRLSDSMEEGTVLQWMKQVGDEVAVGDEIVEIETDKANMAYESDVAGTLTEIIAEEGATLPIGEPIARIGDSAEGSEASAAGPGEGEGAETAETPTAAAEVAGEEASPEASGDGERIKASPVAKRLAKEKRVDLSTIEGSGPNGRIVKKDVKLAAASAGAGDAEAETAAAEQSVEPAPAAPAAVAPGPDPPSAETAKGQTTIQEPTKLQSTVARRMSESKATAPHFYLEAEIDMSKAVAARRAIRGAAKEGEVVPSFNDMVVKACAIALREFPKANGAYRDGRFELYSRVNVGIAVAAQGALVVPTVFDADKKGLRQIASDSRAVAGKVRDGKITPPELSGGTFTVSNLGMFRIDNFSAVINSPQAAILAVGAIVEKPAVREGQIVPAQLMNVTLACDHRILYGAEGAELLARVRTLLEEPVSLAL
ncbi:MAG: 2-oxo acid dehydrogenase subunit E2 [Solirubrobacterales bacterium]|nr:2-oxo acid dehydrogenase subunit E2 [Solirubrobacterales bacterium]